VKRARGLVEELESPHPLAHALPGIYEEDDFVERFTQAFDAALAPIFSTLDNIGAYLDPELTPEDFLAWLASWVGATLDEGWPLDRRRALVARAVPLYRRRGTVQGLAEQVALIAGERPKILDSGGVSWSVTPESPLPGSRAPRMTVRLHTKDASVVGAVEALVASAKPAHLVAAVEVVTE
jgi:phage tail-like protein